MKKKTGRPLKLGPNPQFIGLRVSERMKHAVEKLAERGDG